MSIIFKEINSSMKLLYARTILLMKKYTQYRLLILKMFLLLQNFKIFATAPYLTTFILEIQSVMSVYSTQLCELLPFPPITFSLVQLSTLPPPPSPPVPCLNKNIVHTYAVCKGRVWVSGPQADKHLPQSPFTDQLLK